MGLPAAGALSNGGTGPRSPGPHSFDWQASPIRTTGGALGSRRGYPGSELSTSCSLRFRSTSSSSPHLPALHERVAVSAAAAGVRSIVEKPPAGNAEGAAALAALDQPPWIAFNRRFEPEVERLRNDHAEPGREIEVVLWIDARRWQAFEGRPGPLLDLGPHAVDVVCWTTGLPPRRVRCEPGRRGYQSFVLELDGAVGRLHLSHQAGWHELVRVGGATYLRRGGRVDRARRAATRRRGPLVATLRAELEAIVGRAVRGVGQVDARLGSAAEGVLVMATLDAMALAAREPGTWVSVDDRMPACSR